MLEAPRRRPAGASLSLEALEARWAPAVLGGYVHDDCNANGLFESSLVGTGTGSSGIEIGIGGSTLQLLDGTGQVIATTTSDATGRYEFTQRDNVSTTPQEMVVDVNFDSAKTDHSRTGTLQQFDPSLGQLLSVSIEVQGSLLSQVQLENLEDIAVSMNTDLDGTIRFELPGITPLTSTVDGTVQGTLGAFDGQADFQGSSSRDFGVTELQGSAATATVSNPSDLSAYVGTGTVQVTESASATSCSCGTGNLMAMVRSMANGRARVVYRYTPSNVIGPGQYTIVQTTQPSGYNDGKDTADNITAIPGSEHTERISTTVTSSTQTIMTHHFGEMQQARLAGGVYYDVDRSGSWVSGEPAIVGVTLQLSGTDAFGTAVTRTTSTDAMGQYAFDGLTRGTYTITEIQPAGFSQGANDAGTLSGTVNGDIISSISVSCGDNGTGYNFGEQTPTLPPPIVNPPPIIVPPPQPLTPQPSKFFFIGRSWLDLA